MRKRLWSPDEDEKLQKYVSQHGFGNWSEVAKKTGLQRCGKSCRLRWINYLRPDLKRGKFSPEEKLIIVNLQKVFGNSWSKIAAHLPGRTDSDIKNFWHSHFRKKRPQQLITSTMGLQNFLPLSSPLHHSETSRISLLTSIQQASSSQYAPFLNTSSSSSSSTLSYLHQHPLFNSGMDSMSSNPNSSLLIRTRSSSIDALSSSFLIPGHLAPFYSSNISHLPNDATNGANTQQQNNHMQVIDQQLTSNLPPPMSDEEVPLYATKEEEEEEDPNHEELIENDFELIGSLCQRTTTWYNDEKVRESITIDSNGLKFDNINNLGSSISTNQSAALEMLMYQSCTSTSSHVHTHFPPQPEGLDLVVWSCVNRPSQHDQDNHHLLPRPPSPHATLENHMHNMTINLQEQGSFLELET